MVTDANARLCRQFITANSKAFRQAEQRYGVPSSIAAALLFVETRLGKVLGDTSENAFYTLASMAVSRTPESISDWLPQLRDHERHMDWIAETMPKRADWAYKETRALVEHMLRDRVPPEHLPGSIYGAVGLCQFMPSNIATYGADGDGDGRVDLFTVPDAVASLSHYLARHGWKAGLSRERQHALLMRYNHSTVYANTIMVAAYYAFVVVTLALGFALDARRAFTYKNKPSEICLANEKHRWGIYYVLVICLLVGYIMQNGGFGGASGFGMYANF